MKDMNSVYMSTCMKALCRHVKQNKLQTDTNFLRVGTCINVFTRSAQLVICCETVRRQKQTVQRATLRCWQAGRKCGTYTVEKIQSPIEKV